jgi:hypothetical protein
MIFHSYYRFAYPKKQEICMPDTLTADSARPAGTAQIDIVQLLAADGTLVMIPRAAFERMQHLEEIVLRVPLCKKRVHQEGWLTVSEAATQHLDDVDGMSLEAARVRVSRGATSKKFVSSGDGKARRIDPTTFAAWRLNQREKSLNQFDRE